MRSWVGFVIVALIVATAPPVAGEDGVHTGRYVAMDGPLVIWCGPDDHDTVQRTLDAWMGNPWWPQIGPRELFAGEPECAPTDILNTIRETQGEDRVEWGWGGFIWHVKPAALGNTASVWTHDDRFEGETFLTVVTPFQDGGAVSVEGCGPQTIMLPYDLENSWYSTYDDPVHAFRAHVPTIGIDDTLDVCLASTGWIHAAYVGA